MIKPLITIDFGSSLIKVALIDKDGVIRWLSIDPHISLVAADYEKCLADQPLSGGGVDTLWVSDFDRTFAVGTLAKTMFRAGLDLGAVKYEAGIYKVLAVLGYLCDAGYILNKSTISVGVLLPFGEYCDRTLFSKALTDAVDCFQFKGQDKKFKIDQLTCYPEGFGLYSRGLSIDHKKTDAGVYILGHRNGTWLRVKYGQCDLNESETNDLGFGWLVTSLQAKTGIKDDLAIARCVYRYLLTQKPTHLDELITVRDPDLRDKEMARLIEHIGVSSSQYWMLQNQWLVKKGRECGAIALGGGTALAYRSQLNGTFPKAQWGKAIARFLETTNPEMAGVGPPVTFKGNPLTYRVLDVFGLMFYLCDPAIAKEALNV